jgi:hypothetical protein
MARRAPHYLRASIPPDIRARRQRDPASHALPCLTQRRQLKCHIREIVSDALADTKPSHASGPTIDHLHGTPYTDRMRPRIDPLPVERYSGTGTSWRYEPATD